jgi:hypothetical protein
MVLSVLRSQEPPEVLVMQSEMGQSPVLVWPCLPWHADSHSVGADALQLPPEQVDLVKLVEFRSC